MENELQTLDFGKIRPGGWIRDQMRKDLDGFVGHLDQLAPELMIDDKIYGEHRLTANIKTKSPGNIQTDDEYVAQNCWTGDQKERRRYL